MFSDIDIASLTPTIWLLLAVAAAFVGLSKTAVPGINTVAIAILAVLLPAKESTGLMLVLLLIGDIFAVLTYRKYADWHVLKKLLPAVIAGLVCGVAFLAVADNSLVRRAIGVILLLVIAVTLWRKQKSASRNSSATSFGKRTAYGSLAGFTTMVANAGGPVMTMYLLSANFSVRAFLGTAAWFFAIVNVSKLPFSVALGLINGNTLLLNLCLAPAVVCGAVLGRWGIKHIPQKVFEVVVIATTVAGALYLCFM